MVMGACPPIQQYWLSDFHFWPSPQGKLTESVAQLFIVVERRITLRFAPRLRLPCFVSHESL
jgi:hypothetical protein